MTVRFSLVGSASALVQDASGIAFVLTTTHWPSPRAFQCYSSAPAVMEAFTRLRDGYLAAIIGTAPERAPAPTGIEVERLEVLTDGHLLEVQP